jgi:cytochrome P450
VSDGVSSPFNQVYEDFQRLNLVLGALYEAMRMFPPVVGIPKKASEDTTLTYQTIPDAEGNSRTETVFVPKGTDVLIDTPALHNNPMYWDNPKEFRPERFVEDYEKDAFIPFVHLPDPSLYLPPRLHKLI